MTATTIYCIIIRLYITTIAADSSAIVRYRLNAD